MNRVNVKIYSASVLCFVFCVLSGCAARNHRTKSVDEYVVLVKFVSAELKTMQQIEIPTHLHEPFHVKIQDALGNHYQLDGKLEQILPDNVVSSDISLKFQAVGGRESFGATGISNLKLGEGVGGHINDSIIRNGYYIEITKK